MQISRRRALALLSIITASTSMPSLVYGRGPGRDEVPEGMLQALDLINRYRALANVPPAELHPSLVASANGHVGYYDQNRDAGMAGLGLHQQSEDRPGFTGASMRDRARAAGYSSGPVTENAGFGGLAIAVEWAMSTVNHRLPLIHPNAVDLGLAESAVSGFNIMAVGVRRGLDGLTLPSLYPANGATGVPRQWDGGETPDPAPRLPRPLGFPVTVCFGLGQKVEWEALELIGPDEALVEVDMRQTSWMSAAALIPHRPLARFSTYVVKLAAVVDGGPVSHESTFEAL